MLNCELEKPTHTQLMTIDNSSAACDTYYRWLSNVYASWYRVH